MSRTHRSHANPANSAAPGTATAELNAFNASTPETGIGLNSAAASDLATPAHASGPGTLLS